MNKQLDHMLDEVYDVIKMFAGGKRYLMRSPLRIWFELGWTEMHGSNTFHPDSCNTGKKSSFKLSKFLKLLEDEGLIRRFPGGIEIMENINGRENS